MAKNCRDSGGASESTDSQVQTGRKSSRKVSETHTASSCYSICGDAADGNTVHWCCKRVVCAGWSAITGRRYVGLESDGLMWAANITSR